MFGMFDIYLVVNTFVGKGYSRRKKPAAPQVGGLASSCYSGSDKLVADAWQIYLLGRQGLAD
jgi:hypothetical protein